MASNPSSTRGHPYMVAVDGSNQADEAFQYTVKHTTPHDHIIIATAVRKKYPNFTPEMMDDSKKFEAEKKRIAEVNRGTFLLILLSSYWITISYTDLTTSHCFLCAANLLAGQQMLARYEQQCQRLNVCSLSVFLCIHTVAMKSCTSCGACEKKNNRYSCVEALHIKNCAFTI
jgi:hypothetical protein